MSPWIKTNALVSTDSPCPAEGRLRELLEQRPDASDQASLVGHLDECATCRDRLQSLAAGADLWSRAAKNLRESGADEYGELTGLMARLQTRMLGADDTVAPFQPGAAPDILRPCSTPGRLGCLGPYEIVEILGRGGMGVVYKAIDPALDRTVAIKVLACAPSFSADARVRFRREARAAAAVHSEHAVVIHAVEETAEPPYLVMEFIEGTSLQERLDRSGPLEINEILRIGSQIARGLAAAHAEGLIHRDVKPANILLKAGTGKVKITDFGLAKAIDAPSLTQTGTMTGTPEYMAPEQTSAGPIDHRVDLFSLGSVLYAICTGRPPFRAERSLAVLRRTREETPVPIRQLRPEVPEALIAIIERLHRKDPNDRYASAAEVADALEQLQAIAAATPLSRFGRGAGGEGTMRRRVRWALLAASLLLAVALCASELTGLTGIASWTVARVRESTFQDTPSLSVASQETAVAVPQPANHEPMLLAAAPRADAKKPAPVAAPPAANAPAKPAAATDDNQPQKITAMRLLEGHTGPVFCVAFSPDGRRAVSCSGRPEGDRTVRLWEVATGKEIRRLRADQLSPRQEQSEWRNPLGEVYAVAFAPDGRRAVFGGANGLAGVWDVETGEVVQRFDGHKGSVEGVAVSADGKQVLTGAQDATVRLWDLPTGKELQRMAGHEDLVRAVAFSPDGTRALSGSGDHTMRLWDLKTGQQMRKPFLGDPGYTVWSVAFAPDGREAVSSDRAIRLWSLSDRRQLRTFDGHQPGPPIVSVAFSPDGNRILSGSQDKTVRLWDRNTGREIATLLGHWNWVRGVAYSLDGRSALSCAGGMPGPGIWLPGNDFAIRLWELPPAAAVPAAGAAEKKAGTIPKLGQRGMAAAAGAAVGAAPPAAAAPPKAVAPADGNRPPQITALRRLEGHTGPVWGIAISPDGKRLVSCSGRPQGDCTVRLWDVATGKEIRRLNADQLPMYREAKNDDAGIPGVAGEVYAVAFAPDGRRSAFAGASGLVGLWDVETGSVIRLYKGYKTPVYSVAFLPDGKRMLTGSADGTARLWDVDTGSELQRLSGHAGGVRCVAVSPDGRQELTGGTSDRIMRLWDLQRGEQIREFKKHQGCIWSVAFTPDGRQAVSGSDTGRLWDLTDGSGDGRLLRTFDAQNSAVVAAISPDGRWILSRGVLSELRLWDRATGREVATLVGHWNYVRSLAFSPDSRYAFSASGGTPPPWRPGNDFAIRVWRLP